MKKATEHWSNILPRRACSEARRWALNQPNAETAWKTCRRGDWMLWLLAKWSGPSESASRKKLVLATCACARIALRYAGSGKRKLLTVITTAEAWARGERGVTVQDVINIANDGYLDFISHSIGQNLSSAQAVHAAACTTTRVMQAVCCVVRVVYCVSCGNYVVKRKVMKTCADIIRRFYTHAPQPSKRHAARSKKT